MQTITTLKTVRFNHVRADEMYLTGDFNHWKVPGRRLEQVRPGCWETQVAVGCGAGRYAAAALVQGRVIEMLTGHISQEEDRGESGQTLPGHGDAKSEILIYASA